LDLKQQEEEMERQEELEIKQKRDAAKRLALERGLSSMQADLDPSSPEDGTSSIALRSPTVEQETIQFPELLPDQFVPETSGDAGTTDGKDPT